MAMLSPSLPQEVKTISAGEQLIRRGHLFRAFSTAPLTARPAQWTLEGFPNCSLKKGSIASSTSGRTGVVALLSM